MPSTIAWKGDAAAVAQVDTLTVGGSPSAGDVYALTIGDKTLSVTAATTNVDTAASNIATAWNLLTQSQAPEFYECVAAAVGSGGQLTITAKTAGKPFTLSVGVTGDSTLTSSTTTASAGPNDASTAKNYSGGALPSSGDTLVLENSSSSLLYGLSALSAVTLANLTINQSFTGTIGLPRNSSIGTASYAEYRPTYLAVGATVWTIGGGNGSGSGRIKINFGSVQFTGQVQNSGTSAEQNIPAVIIKGTHASNALTVLKGSVGVAFFAAETSVLATLNLGYVSNVNGDANVQCGSGTTLTTVVQAGGSLSVASNITTLTQYAGTITVGGTATITTGTISGTMIDQSTGTFTTLTCQPKAVYDHSRSMSAKTITTFKLSSGGTYSDPYGVVTLTNGILLVSCQPSNVTINIPTGKTLSVS